MFEFLANLDINVIILMISTGLLWGRTSGLKEGINHLNRKLEKDLDWMKKYDINPLERRIDAMECNVKNSLALFDKDISYLKKDNK